MAEYRHYANPHPHWSDVWDWVSPDGDNASANDLSQFPHNLPSNTKICGMSRDHLPISSEDDLTIDELGHAVKTKDESEQIILRTYRRSVRTESLPLLIYIHGGGFVTGGLETDDALCRAIARNIDVFVVNVKYRLAPENGFPDGFEDCLQVIKWVHASFHQHSTAQRTNILLICSGSDCGRPNVVQL